MGRWGQSVAAATGRTVRPKVLGHEPERPFTRIGRVTAKGALHAFESRSVKAGFLRDRLCEEASQMHADAVIDVSVRVEGLLWRRRMAVRGVAIRYTEGPEVDR